MSTRSSVVLRSVAVAAVFLTGAVPALANDLTVAQEFFGDRPGPGTAVDGAALMSHNSFLSGMSASSSFGFEASFPTPVTTFTMNNPDLTTNRVDITGNQGVNARIGDSVSATNGRFNTTSGGTRWLDIVATTVSFSFEDPFAAIGIYLTDIGDFESLVTLSLRNSVTGAETTFDLTSRLSLGERNQNLVFWGYSDPTGASYNRLTINTVRSQDDRFGIDDITLGVPTVGAVPVPATLGLALAALGLLALRRRT
jgi:hypothetical protein